ncbi:hypothetical protein Tco_0724842 [Tanacetum coccineum]|uniref:Uncharacterized protein n=1 Tax=Tanacetum coccineum TaxID=301880 RepID=A0ABQ4YC87_9ASTR
MSMLKYVSYPRFISYVLAELLGTEYAQDQKIGFLPGVQSNLNFSKDPSKVTEIELTTSMIVVNNLETSVSILLAFGKKKKKRKTQIVSQPPLKTRGPEASSSHPQKRKHAKPKTTTLETQVLKACHSQLLLIFKPCFFPDDDLSESEDDEFEAGDEMDEDIHQADKYETQATFLKSLNIISETLEADPALKEEMKKMTESNTIISRNITNIIELLRNAHLPEVITKLDAFRSTLRTLRMMTEMLQVFKEMEMSSSTPLGSASIPTATQPEKPEDARTKIVEEEPARASRAIPISTPETEIIRLSSGLEIDITSPEQPEIPPVAPKVDKGKGIVTDDIESPKKLVKASIVFHPNHDEPVRVPYMIHGKMYQLIDDEIQEHMEKEDKIKKAVEEAKLLAMSKLELIKVVQEEATKVDFDPKILGSEKGGQEFKKIQDAELKVLNKEHSQKIHANTKPAVIIIYKGTDRRNFEVHNPFQFGDFGITELDELGPIIEKKKNKSVGELMISLGKRYERLNKIPEELRIQSALPAPAQA